MARSKSFDVELWREWMAETNPIRKQAIGGVLLKANLPLAMKFVNRFMKRSQQALEQDDLVQAACMGLMKTMERFNPEKGKFSTIAAHWIRDALQQCAIRQSIVYRPRGAGMPYLTHRAREKFLAVNGREPTAAELGVTQAELDRWQGENLRVQSMDVACDHAPDLGGEALGGGARTRGRHTFVRTHHDVMGNDAPNACDLLDEAQTHKRLYDAMATLTERERRIFEACADGQKLLDIGKRENLSGEGVRFIRLQVEAKLREALGDEQ